MSAKNSETANLIEHLKELSTQDFRNFGLHQIAYITPKTEKDKKVYAIYSADGHEVTTAKSKELAIVIAKQNELDPVAVQ